MHGPTFMANPLACAAACASIDLLIDQSKESLYPGGWQVTLETLHLGLTALNQLAGHEAVENVRILGGIGVVEMRNKVDVAKVQAELVKHSVWVRPFACLIYVMPPYILTKDEIGHLCGSIIEVVNRLY